MTLAVMLVKSSPELVRQQNSAFVLQALRRHSRMAHTEISDATGLSSATVSAITADLERCGVIEKSESIATTGRGRPRVMFSQRRDYGYLAVAIISSDSVQYSLVDYGGTLLDRFSEPRRDGGPDLFLKAFSAALQRLIGRSKVSADQVMLVSVSSKGLVDVSGPVLVWSPVFGNQAVDFGLALKDDWGAGVILNNETLLVAGALLERQVKAGQGHKRLAALSLGHSIGLGLARTAQFGVPEVSAPNFGHMLHIPDGGLCRCGARGCIEAYAGFYAILRHAFEVPRDTIPAKFVPMAEVDKIAAQARHGGRMAIHAFRQAGVALGNGLSRLLSLHGQMAVVVTGPGTRHYDLLQKGIEEGLSQSQVVRLEGMPDLSVVIDEPALVFEGHLNRAFSILDQEIIGTLDRAQIAGE